jgi:hypothetical protein
VKGWSEEFFRKAVRGGCRRKISTKIGDKICLIELGTQLTR